MSAERGRYERVERAHGVDDVRHGQRPGGMLSSARSCMGAPYIIELAPSIAAELDAALGVAVPDAG